MAICDDPRNQASIERLTKILSDPGGGVTPFVGAGLSWPWTRLGWSEFLLEMASTDPDLMAEVKFDLAGGRFEEAAERISTHFGRKAFDRLILDKFGDHALRFPDGDTAMGLVPRLATGPVVTTNYDRVLERVFRDAGQAFDMVLWGGKAQLSADSIDERRRTLIKLHGDVGDSKDRILTRSEYRSRYAPRSGLRRVLTALFGRRSVLFLGCSVTSDRYLTLIRGGDHEHFACVGSPGDEVAFATRSAELSKWGITPIWYPEGRFNELVPFLAFLSEIAPRRVDGPQPADFASQLADTDRTRDEILKGFDAATGDEDRVGFLMDHGERLANLGYNEDYVELAERCTEAALRLGDRMRAALLQYNSHIALKRLGGAHFSGLAEKCRRRAQDLLAGLPPHSLGAILSDDVAVDCLDRSDFAGALAASEEALLIARKIGYGKVGDANMVQIRRHHALALSGLGRHDAAAKSIRSCLIAARKSDDPHRLAETLSTSAEIDENRGRMKPARRAWEEAIRLFEETSNWRRLAWALTNLGVNHHRWGSREDMLICYDRAQRWIQQIGNEGGAADLLSNMAWRHYEDGRKQVDRTQRKSAFLRSDECYEQATAIARYLGDPEWIASMRAQRSLVSWELGRRKLAMKYLEQAKRAAVASGDDDLLALTWQNRALLLDYEGKRQESLVAVDRAIALARGLNDERRLAILYGNKAALDRGEGAERSS